MSAKKFTARNTIEAIRLVKKTLGDDAVIISNRNVNGVVEIIAMSANDIDSVTENAQAAEIVDKKEVAKPTVKKEKEKEQELDIHDFCGEIMGEIVEKDEEEETEDINLDDILKAEEDQKENDFDSSFKKEESDFDSVFKSDSKKEKQEKVVKDFVIPSIHASQAKTLIKNLPKNANKEENEEIVRSINESKDESEEEKPKEKSIPIEILLELRSLRKIVANNMNKQSGQNMVKVNLLKKLLLMGFTPKVAASLMERMPKNAEPIEAETFVKNKINKKMKIIKVEDEIISKGGIYALIGPTGVGKTTTVAKLASRAIMKLGAENVALITTDNYRIAAHEQLKIYADLLGIPIVLVENEKEFNLALKKLSKRKLILIDTTGMSQKDAAVKGLVTMLDREKINNLLLLPASSRTEILDDIIKSYSAGKIDGCILTKEDEAEGVMNIIDAVLRHDLQLFYVCNGQRVPEDIVFPNKKNLINKAFSLFDENSIKKISELELALLMSEFSID